MFVGALCLMYHFRSSFAISSQKNIPFHVIWCLVNGLWINLKSTIDRQKQKKDEYCKDRFSLQNVIFLVKLVKMQLLEPNIEL